MIPDRNLSCGMSFLLKLYILSHVAVSVYWWGASIRWWSIVFLALWFSLKLFSLILFLIIVRIADGTNTKKTWADGIFECGFFSYALPTYDADWTISDQTIWTRESSRLKWQVGYMSRPEFLKLISELDLYAGLTCTLEFTVCVSSIGSQSRIGSCRCLQGIHMSAKIHVIDNNLNQHYKRFYWIFSWRAIASWGTLHYLLFLH